MGSSGNMLRFLTLAALAISAYSDMGAMKKMHKDMMVFNSQSACWGKGNMIYFQVALKEAMESCMQENHSGLLKPANPILALLNQNANTLPFPVNKIDLSQTMAGEDPEWRNMLVTSYKDCYDIARSWPQSTLNRNPLMKVFGRHMVFFKCAGKEEAKACGMACANDMLTTLYGSNDAFDWTQYGMPQNKYERAAWTMKIMYGTASHEEHFVHDFFFSDPNDVKKSQHVSVSIKYHT